MAKALLNTTEKLIYQLKIVLDETQPEIWRRFQVPAYITLSDLHEIIQIIMGWENCHHHQFVIKKTSYRSGQENGHFSVDSIFSELSLTRSSVHDEKDENKYRAIDLITKEKSAFQYEYDFGDSWQHTIILEKIIPMENEMTYAVCLEGELACPPEDCGSIPGYYNLIEILKDKEHEEYEAKKDWAGDYDYNYFDLRQINSELRQIKIPYIAKDLLENPDKYKNIDPYDPCPCGSGKKFKFCCK